MFDTQIKLITALKTTNTKGFDIPSSNVELMVMAEKRSVSKSEVYQAMQNNLSPSTIFLVHSDEWALTRVVKDNVETYATHVLYNGITYEVIRIGDGSGKSQLPPNTTEIVCG
jgi:SPP1 family predicted phage head-tail adaptor